MKKTLINKIAYTIVLIWLFSSCNNQKSDGENEKGSNTGNTSTKQLWAEQVSSITELKKPPGWSDADWNSVTKNVNQEKIYNEVMEAILNGKQQAYDYITDAPLTIDEVRSIIHKADTVFEEVKGQMKPLVTITNIDAADIAMVRVSERWLFDKEKFKLEKQPAAIAFFVNAFSEDSLYIGDRALFYVRLNN